MHRKLFFIIITLLISSAVFSQKDDPIVFKINGKPVYWSEVKRAYDKGNEYAEEKESIADFIQSYADYKSNIEEARTQNIDTTSIYKRSYESFKNQIAGAYMTKDTVYESEYIKNIYSRLLENIEVNHVLIPFAKELVLPSDTAEVYKKALETRNNVIKNGFDSEELQSGKITPFMSKTEDRNGYLGWVTAFMFPFTVENALYSLPLKEISQPIRSHKGYHIVQVLSKRPSTGSVEVEQVLFSFPKIPPSAHQIDSVKSVAQREYSNIHSTADFTSLCEEFSAAHQTGKQGCYFGVIGLDTPLDPDFKTAAFNLEKPGDVSRPALSNYGYHILRLLRKIPVPEFDKLKDQLKEKIIKSDKAQELSDGSRRQIIKDLNVEINRKAYARLEGITDSLSPRDSLFNTHIKNGDDILLSIDGKRKYQVKEFDKYLRMRQKLLQSNPDELPMLRIEEATPYSLSTDILKEYLNAFIVFLAEDYERSILEEKNPAFKQVMNEYADGILLFEVKNRNIWKRAKDDEKGLNKVFSDNESKYTLDREKYKGMIVYAKDENSLNEAQAILKNTATKEDFIEKIREALNKDSVVVMIEPGSWEKGANQHVDYKIFGGAEPKMLNKRFPFYFVSGKLINKPEDFTDVRGAVEADYQTKLENDWNEYIRNKYKIEFNKPFIKKLK